MTDIQELVSEFQDTFKQEPDPELQIKLVREEFLELAEALRDPEGDPYDVAKELADLLYVTYGLAHMLGINAQVVVEAVHKSNMSKVDDNGNPVFREDGKVAKTPNYLPPRFERSWFK